MHLYDYVSGELNLPVDISHLQLEHAWSVLVHSILRPPQSDCMKDVTTIVMTPVQLVRFTSLCRISNPRLTTCPFSAPNSFEIDLPVCSAGPEAGAVAFGAVPHPDPNNFMYICNIQVNGISLVGILLGGMRRFY
jgi:hypothetical protein